jgi:hypothetical protein
VCSILCQQDLCQTLCVRHSVSDTLCQTLCVKYSVSNILCQTPLKHSVSGALCQTLRVQQPMSNTLCLTSFVQHPVSTILCQTLRVKYSASHTVAVDPVTGLGVEQGRGFLLDAFIQTCNVCSSFGADLRSWREGSCRCLQSKVCLLNTGGGRVFR